MSRAPHPHLRGQGSLVRSQFRTQPLASKTLTASQARREMQRYRVGPNPILTFNLVPEPCGGYTEYFEVEIYRDSRALQTARQRTFPGKDPVPVWGFTRERHRGRRAPRQCGTIALYLGSVTHNVVAHEIWHATAIWTQRIKLHPAFVLKYQAKTHERVAEAHGNMVSQFWRKFTEHYPPVQVWGWEKWANPKS